MTDAIARLEKLGISPTGNIFVPPSQKELEEIESITGFSIPPDYFSVISKFGWSNFPEHSVVVSPLEKSPNHEKFRVGTFLGGERGQESLLRYVRILRGRLPDTLIPIAFDEYNGDFFCLVISGNEKGKVFYWESQFEPDEPEHTEPNTPDPEVWQFVNLTLVADSFSDFVNRMEIEPEEAVV